MERSDPNITEIYAEILNLNTKIISRIPFIIHPTVKSTRIEKKCEHAYKYIPSISIPEHTHTALCDS